MSPTFIAFLSMLAAFLLLTLAAAVRWVWLVFHPAGSVAAHVGKTGEPSMLSDGLLLIGVATAWYSVSAGWGGQFTLYPIYADLIKVGPEAFNAFGHSYLSHLPITLLPLGVMCLAWVGLLWTPSCSVPRCTVWAIVGLGVVFVAVTPFAALAQDQMLASGFSKRMFARLLWANGLRSVCFTGIGLLSLTAVQNRWTRPARR